MSSLPGRRFGKPSLVLDHILCYSLLTMTAPKGLPALLALALLSSSAAVPAQETVGLAVDVAPGPASSVPIDPRQLVPFQGQLFFVGESPWTGRELFRTDTTVEGTSVVADICPGRCSSDPEMLTLAGDHLFFQACDLPRGCQLWSSDGTAAGTRVLTDYPAVFSLFSGVQRIWQIVAWNGQAAYLTATGEVFLSDGTVDGTRLLADLAPGDTYVPIQLVPADSKLFLLGHQELRASDGDGAEKLLEKPGSYLFGPPLAVGDRLFFVEGSEPAVWTSDGTAAGTVPVLRTAEIPALLFRGGARVYFAVRERQSQSWRLRLFTSDGTAAGTQPVGGVPPIPGLDAYQAFAGAGDFAQREFIRREEISAQETRSGLWRLDAGGTSASLVAELDGWTTAAGADRILYLATGYPSRLYRSLGPGWSIALLRDWGSGISELTPSGSDLFLRAVRNGAFTGKADLAMSGGTPETTRRLHLLFSPPSSDPSRLVAHQGRLLFSSRPLGKAGLTDATPGGTLLFGDRELFGFSAAGRAFFFETRIFSGGLWVLEEDGELTQLLSDGAFAQSAFVHDGRLFFLAQEDGQDLQLWTSDGTAAGTEVVHDDLGPFSLACPNYCPEPPLKLIELGSHFYFPILDVLWRSDGTTGGTEPAFTVADVCPSCSYSAFGDFYRVKDRLYFFLADTNDLFLFESDGSLAGSELVFQAEAGNPSSTGFITEDRAPAVAGDQLFFIRSTTDAGGELWRSDGTAGGTRLVRDIRPGPLSSRAQSLRAFGGRLYFAADDGVHGLELWTSDGTEEGTRLVADLRPGPEPAAPQDLAAAGRLFFAADDGVHGLEPWTIDAPGSAPRLLQDIVPGSGSSSPREFVRSGTRVYFNAGNPEAGFELWALELGSQIFTDGFESGDTSAWSLK